MAVCVNCVKIKKDKKTKDAKTVLLSCFEPSIKKLTIALKACHFPYGKIHGVRGWYAKNRKSDRDL